MKLPMISAIEHEGPVIYLEHKLLPITGGITSDPAEEKRDNYLV